MQYGEFANHGIPTVIDGDVYEKNVTLILKELDGVLKAYLKSITVLKAGCLLYLNYGMKYWKMFLFYFEISEYFKNVLEWALVNDNLVYW